MRRSGWCAAAFGLAALLLGAPHAEAVQIKQVQGGIANFDADDVVQAVNLTNSVNQTKSIILLTANWDSQAIANGSRDQNGFFTGQFEDNDTIAIDRAGALTYASVMWQVIEFEDGVSVQRGISSMQPTVLQKDVTIPVAINTAKAVPIITTRGAFITQNQTQQMMLLPTFTSSTNLRLNRNHATGTKALQIVWQVIEFLTDASIYTGQVCFPVPGVAATNQTVTNDGVDAAGACPANSPDLSPVLSSSGANAFIIPYPTALSTGLLGWDNHLFVRGTVTDNNTLTFTRGGASTTASTEVVVRYYVVDLTDGTSLVQKGTQQWTATPARVNITSSTDATPIVITAAAAHGLATNDLISISGHATATPVNGTWQVTNLTSTTFSLQGSTTHGLGGGTGGALTPAVKTAITSVAKERTMGLVAFTQPSNAASNTTRDYADDMFLSTGKLISGTSFYTLRSSTAQGAALTVDAQYFVTEFAPLTITSPNGGETWKVGEARNITWKHAAQLITGGACGGVNHGLKIELSVNSGSSYLATAIVNPVCANLDTYAWTIPASISSTDIDVTTARIKITDNDLTTRNSDVSNADFTIKGTVTVTVPNTNVAWYVGDACPGASCRTITWSKTGNLDDNGTVTIKLWKNSGSLLDSTIVTGRTPSSGTYDWPTVPDLIRNDLRVGVEASWDAGGVNDKSDVDFQIKGRITVTTPNGVQVPNWEAGKSYNITWTTAGTLPGGGVDLFYSTNSGGSYATPNGATIATGYTGGSPYSWSVPTAAIGTFDRIKVQQNGDVTTFDESDSDVTVVASIVVTSPNLGTEVWNVGTSQNITWTINGTGITNVKLDYSTGGCGGSFNQIVASTGAAAGTYPWTIPDAIGGNVCVKISNAADAAVFDTSNAAFRIKGAVAITSPNGTEVLPIGGSYNIQWSNNGTITGNVEIRYSTDGGGTYPNQIIAATAIGGASGSYTWTNIPDVSGGVSNTVKVKVLPADTTNISEDVSDNTFSIKGTLTLTAPNTAVSWVYGGAAQNITWTKTGSIGNVELHYSTDSGSSFPAGKLIATGLNPATGTPYSWTIPDDLTTTARVRVRLVSDTTVSDMSDVNFNIKGSLTVVAPNNGEVWKVGETSRNITWTRSGTTGAMTGNVELRYSTDGGSTYPVLINNTTAASALTYNWNPIPDAIDNDIRVKITLLNDTSVIDESDANFTIKGVLTVTAPNTNVSWIVGATGNNITWTTAGTISLVNLYYSVDSGSNYPNTIASGLTNVGSYNWNPIPDSIGATRRVKVESGADSTVFDTSDVDFTIKGSLTLTAPNGGQIWAVGDTGRNITWSKTGTLSGDVKLLYSTDGGATFPDPGNKITDTVAVTALTYNWNPIPNAIDNDLRIRIVYASDTTVADNTDANFEIKGSLTITAPDGGEVWQQGGTSQNIVWTKTGTLGNVELRYSTDGGSTYPNLITGSVSSTSPYSWTIPTASSATSTTARVKITLLSDSAVTDASNNDFRIKSKLALTAPNGGQTWVVGDPQDLTWTPTGNIANVKLQYSTDGGSTYPAGNVIIASTAAGAGSYTWAVADGISAQCRVRVSDAADASVVDDSDADFTIKGSLTLTAPNGGQAWVVGTSQNITWTKTGTLANVKLDYSADGGSTYPNAIIASTSGGALSYAWTIPDSIGANRRVKVIYDTTPDVLDLSDTSDANFTIRGSITLTAPNGSEGWAINASQNIVWTKTGTLTGNLKLEYSTDGGSTYPVGNLISDTVAASGTQYAWTVPDNPSSQARVRVTQLNDTNVTDQSDANFSIKGSLFIVVPNGGEVWKVGEARNVTWTRGGAIANAKLDYSVDGGATYPNAVIASTPAANLSYGWTIPDSIDNDIRVKITDVGDATVNDASDGNFSIKGIVTLTAPNGGETWIVNAGQNITWTKSGTIPNVKLEYSVNGGTSFPNVIAASTAGSALSYAWTVPDAIGTQLRVRITNVDDVTVTDDSNANFTIKGSVTLTAPNGAETWIVNSSQNVTWTKQGSIANVKLEYSKNGFADELQTFTIVASTATAPLSYAWTVADAIGSAVKVRVSDALDATVNDISNANFTIKGALLLTAPNGGEAWAVLGNQNVTWTRTGSIANVKLEYSTNSGSTYPNSITASTDAATGSYTWTIPDNLSATAKVKATDVSDATVFDESNAVFKIVGSFTVTAPNGGEKWTVGGSQNVTWTKVGSIANAKLEYSTDGGTSYPTVIVASTTASNLSYAWTIPNTPTATAKVRVSDVADATVLDVSNANFKIKAGLTLTAPNGGEVWTVNSAQNITWTTVGTAANVKLEYSTDGGNTYPTTIIASTSNTGTYSWTVADSISTSVRVKVSDAGDADAFDTSDGNFKIRGAVTLTAPNGAEAWPINSSQNVTWTRVGTVVNVKLEHSTNGFSDELQTSVIIASTAASVGTYAWTIPDAPGTTNKVRVSDASDATVTDLSNANFKIQGVLTIAAPNGGEVWVVGAAQNITWTKLGNIANVELRYSADGGSTYPAGKIIVASTAAAPLSYSWTIPDDISTTLRVKITDAADSAVTDESNANFKIKGSIVVTAPNGGETWIVGASQNITWTRTGSFANVKLVYSTNGFSDELQNVTISASAPAAPLSFAWTIPDAIGTTLKVRASDAADAIAVTDTSNANFEIKGSLTLASPNGGELWKVAESRNITWTKTGTIPLAKLEYSTNGGTTYPNVIIASTDATTGSYAWTVPDTIGTQLRVKITSTADATVNDASNANFEIKGSVTLTAPNGSEVWIVNAGQNITWTRTGSFANVKLEYSTNAFADELQTTTIIASTPADPAPTDNAGTYAWTVPDAISATLRVRITNTADTAVVDTSDANFKITGSVTLTAPNGGELWTVGTSQNVTWTKVGSIANMKLEYSANGGSTYPNVIVGSTGAGSGAYAWTIPDAIGTNRRVRVSDASDATVNDASNADFTIMGGFTVTAPNGGEVWTVGSAQTLTWTTTGTVANVKLEYSTDGGSAFSSVITASTANTGSYGWTVADAITTLGRLRVSDVNNANALDVSNANFKIRGALLLTAPNGAEAWPINASRDITWTRTGSLPNVKLEYSTDGFSDELQTTTIIASTPADPAPSDNNGIYAWTVPDAPGIANKVRVSDASDATVNDLSNANFKIQGVLTIAAPNGGEVWVVGANQNITWTKLGNIANVELRYSNDGGSTYPAGKIITASTAAAPLSYSWTIPDDISATLRVKITDAADSAVTDESNANFKIRGSVTLTAPNGGETWIVGASQNITWTRVGSFANVKLDYSTNGGTTYPNTIVASTSASPLTYAWTVPDAIGTQLRVKVSDAADTAAVNDGSNADFEIKGSVAVLSPNGGEVWKVGESRNITWTKTGTFPFIKLEYSINAGTSYPNVISASTDATTGTYAWTVPDAIGTQLRVKITSTADAAVNDASNANFEIKGQLTLTAPNGGEVWTVNSSQNLTWTKQGTYSTVKLEYSTNGFANELQTTVITASADAVTGTPYAWTVPDAIGTTVRVRVTNNADATVVDASDANFKIAGSLTVTVPNGGEVWMVGTAQNVTWTKVGSIANAKLEYSTNAGSSYPNLIVASTGAGSGAYAWTIPDAIGATLRVKISDASDSTVNDASNANFKILGGFTLSAPNGGEVWTVSSSQNIAWTTSGSIANVKLEYSTDAGSTYPNTITATTPNTGTYGWTVPDAISTTVKVRISDVLDAAAFKVSAGNFKIRGGLLLTVPNGGEAWPIASSQNITWVRTGAIANAKLEYSTDGGTTYPNLITASTGAAAQTYAWTIPNTQSTTVRVRITDVADATVLDASDANFKIKGVLTLAAPNGGEVWIVGSGYNITWTKTGAFIATIELRYSTDSGATYPIGKVIIASTAADTLSYNWTIPDDIASTVRVRITDLTDTSIIDDSNANFSIKGSLTVAAPNGGETWVVSDAQNVTWTKTGTIPNVKLEYSKNGFSDELQTFTVVASVASTPATYAWTIPDAISSTVKVRVSNVGDATVYDLSNANFAIKGSLIVNAPNGGETWLVGASQPVTWSRVGSIANAKLEYSVDGGVSYPNVIVASTAASAGSYGWTIPDAITTTARVKITDVSDSAVFDTSNTNFKIAGSLTVAAPNGAEAWLIGNSQNITWTKTGSIANVKLEYSTNGGSTYPNLITASVDATLGTPYAWTIPDAPTTQAKVRVTNTADALVFDESNANFNIRGSITVTNPNGAEVWVVGASQNITWTRTGSFANVELRYSTDSGSTYPNVITASTGAGALTYAWTIPDAISTTVRVKATDTGDSAVTDASNADFKIKGSVVVTAPNGAEVWIVGASQNITWTRTGSFANVKLEYSTDGGATYLNVISASAPAAPLTYAWTVPDAIGTTLRVKISDAADTAAVSDASDANFTIKGSLTLNAPNGGEIWVVGTSQNITWGKTGTIANVKLEYSTDGGLTYPNVITLSTLASNLTYAWTIPDTLSTTARVKITNLIDSSVTDTSNANFKISGELVITAPNGGEVWIVNATQNVTWTKAGSIATARLDYSTDGGVSYPNIITTSVAASALTFAWTVPDNMSSTVKVKITDNADSVVADTSNANFKIAGSFTITAPNGGEKWAAGSIQSITWTKTGSIVNAKIEYSTDGGSSYPGLIVATTPANNLSYAWTLGSTTSTQFRVKITDVADATVFDTSNANFKVMGGFTLSAPNGGEVWVVGANQNIAWTTVGSVANVKLTYSVNGGTTYPSTISASTTNTGTYGWTIPDAIGTTLRVKVEDVLDVDAFDESNANFKIKGSLTVGAPNGGEIWTVSSAQNITWTKTGSIANVKLEYSTDGGTTYPGGGQVIAAAVSATTGTPFSWTIPDAITTTVRVKATDVTDTTVFDESNANFTIRGSFTVTAPNGSEKWTVGTTQAVTWTTFGTIPNAKLEYSTDAGATFPNVIVASTANTGTYNWGIPNAISAAARVRVSNAADPGTLDTSDANFKIKAGFTVTSPDGGEVLVVGASHNMAWTTAGTASNVKLEYSTNGGTSYLYVISASTSNSGTFNWTVPDAISATVRVRVSDATDTADAFDTSNGNFKIRAGFTLGAPNGGEAWPVGTSRNVTWTGTGTVANVKLEYSTDGGSTYPNVIIASVANTSPYAWTIPDAITASARVRISDVNDVTANDVSNSNFKIQGSLVMTAPNGGEKWTVSSGRTVTWNRAGSISFVKLDFSTDGGSIYAPITASTSNTGSYAWTIPDNISTNCFVKVTDTNDATVNDVSDAAFKIQAGFIVVSPNGGEVWGVGNSRNITWTTNGTVNFVKIDLSLDSGATFPNQITTSTTNSGTYGWTVPDSVSGTLRVRVSQTTDAEAFDTSDGNFRIRAALTLSSPNGAEQWRVAQSQNVGWSVVGTIANVKLQYSRDAFNADVQTIVASTANTSPYAWTIPDSISNTVRGRVSDPNDIGAFDDSNADFRITGDFTVTSPNGGEQWTVGSSQNITWTKTGSVANAKIELSTNSGGSWTTIAGLVTNNGTYAWTVPDSITAAARVRVSDPADATANDISNADFKIKSLLAVIAPNGGEIWTVSESRNLTWTNTGTVALMKIEYSTNGGTSYAPITENYGTPNDGIVLNTSPYAWTVQDAISTQVRIKVSSSTDTDAFDASDANFKIRGSLTLTYPNGGENLDIASVKTVTWTRVGSIANVKLLYSTDSGSTYPNTITASTGAAAGTYNWTIPDVPSTTVRLRIEDISDATVFDTSDANFGIVGNFVITAPNGGEVWKVAESRNIAWTWGGTIPTVKLLYSTNSGSAYPNVIAASAPNGSGSSGSFTYAWTVPDSISNTARVRIENTANSNTFDTSNADFKIRGDLALTAPNGAERWIVNDNRGETGTPLVNYSLIRWATTGTIPTVKLEYSTDAGVTYPNLIAASVANPGATNSYNWMIPASLGTQVRVKVTNTADTTVFDDSNANFTIDKYKVSFRIRDLLSNNNLDQLSVDAKTFTNSLDPLVAKYQWAASALTSPMNDQPLEYGTWAVKFSRTSYGDQTIPVVVDRDYPAATPVDVFMETQVVHIWESVTELAYVPFQAAIPGNTPPVPGVTESLSVTTTLRRDGIVVPGAVYAKVEIFDGGTSIKTFTCDGAPDTQGFYRSGLTQCAGGWNAWTSPGLAAGKVYNVVTEMRIASGGVFKSPRTFTVNVENKLQETKNTVDQKLDVPMSAVRSDISNTLTSFQNSINTSITTLNSAVTSSQTASNTLINAASQSQAAANDLRTVAFQQSAKILAPPEVTTGLPMVIRWRGPKDGTGLAPKITIENFDKVSLYKDVPMTAVSGATNLFEWNTGTNVLDAKSYPPGKTLTVSVQDDTIGSLQVSTIFVKRPEGRLIMKTTAKVGEKISIQLAGADTWKPSIQLTADGVELTAATAMTRVASDGKIATFEYKVPESIGTMVPIGKSIIAVVTEPITGFFDQGSFQFTATSLDDLSGQIAASATSRSTLQETLDAVKDVKGSLDGDGSLGQKLETMKLKIDRLPKAISEDSANVKMKQAINTVAETIRNLAGNQGLDFSELVKKGVEEAPTLKDIRKQTDEVQGATEIMQLIMEQKLGGVDDPVVHVIFE